MHDNDVEPDMIDPCGLFFTREATYTSVTLAYGNHSNSESELGQHADE